MGYEKEKGLGDDVKGQIIFMPHIFMSDAWQIIASMKYKLKEENK